MNQLIHQLQSVLPDGMTIPKEIEMLYQYIEENGYFIPAFMGWEEWTPQE